MLSAGFYINKLALSSNKLKGVKRFPRVMTILLMKGIYKEPINADSRICFNNFETLVKTPTQFSPSSTGIQRLLKSIPADSRECPERKRLGRPDIPTGKSAQFESSLEETFHWLSTPIIQSLKETHYVAEAALEFTILLEPPPPKRWDFRHVSPNQLISTSFLKGTLFLLKSQRTQTFLK